MREGLVHHSASMQVFAESDGGGSRFVWISDFLPDDLAASFGPLIDQGTAAMRRTLEGAAQPPPPPPSA